MKRIPSTNGSFQRYAAAWTLALACALFFSFARPLPAQERESAPRFDESSWREDGFPFQPRNDADAIRSIWSTLDAAPDARPFAKAVTLQLLKQGPRYRGKLLSIRGRLLRADRVALSETESGYDLWILLPDDKRTPIRLITRDAPDAFAVDAAPLPDKEGDPNVEYRHETVVATGVYYRTTAYDAGDDFLAAPTLVGTRFSLATPQTAAGPDGSRANGTLIRVAAVLAIVAVWLALRRRSRGKKRERVEPLVVAAILALGAASSAMAAEDADAPLAGPEFWGRLAGVDADAWSLEAGDDRPRLDEGTPESAQRREEALAILGISDRLLTADVLLARGDDVALLRGTLDALETIALSPAEEERLGAETLYRATIVKDDASQAAVYLTRLPTFAAPESFFDGPVPQSSGIGERVGVLGIRFGMEDAGATAAFLATRADWFPASSPLGRAEIDVAAFAEVPVYPHDALQNARSHEESEKIARSMRWTTADRRAFYGSLQRAFAEVAEDRREPVDVVRLFNEPERNQGARVKLRGWVRRVNMILVTDPEVKAQTGLERYYQLFLFTDDTQGWPVTLCVPELPEGLEPGGGSEYRRVLEFEGFFYKTWAYRSSAKDAASPEPEDENAPIDPNAVQKWTRAPVAIGRVTRVEPEEERVSAPWSSSELFLGFAILAGAWIVLRRVSASRQKRTTRFHS